MERYWLHPVLATFVRGFGRALAPLTRPSGTTLALTIAGDAGGTWFAVLGGDGWDLREAADAPLDATVTLPPDIAWRLFTKGVSPREAERAAVIEGDRELAGAVFAMVSILA